MSFGIEMLLKSFGITPEGIRENLKSAGELAARLQRQLDNIERNQARIMQHMGIENEQEDTAPSESDGGIIRRIGSAG